MTLSRPASILLFVLPAFALSRSASKRIEACASAWGAELGRIVQLVAPENGDRTVPSAERDGTETFVSSTADVAGEPLDDGDEVPRDCPKSRGSSHACSPAGKGKGARTRSVRRGLFVDARTVLRLAEAGASPRGFPVPAGATHPAGLSLSGVSSLGVGALDGDVLTTVEGRSVRTEGEVIAAVLRARLRRAIAIHAAFFRAGQPWSLVVEMPYVSGS